MKFIVVFGPERIGKTKIGNALADTLGYGILEYKKLIEFIKKVYGYVDEELAEASCVDILNRFTENKYSKNLVFTYNWCFSDKVCNLAITKYQQIIKTAYGDDAQFFYVELFDSIDIKNYDREQQKKEMIQSARLLTDLSTDILTLSYKFTDKNYMCINIYKKQTEDIVNDIIKNFSL